MNILETLPCSKSAIWLREFNSVPAVNDVTTKIDRGEVVFIVGPSGSGKSTFLRCLNLLEEPTSGEIRFKGKLITSPGTDVNQFRQHVGMVFQHFNLFPAPDHSGKYHHRPG